MLQLEYYYNRLVLDFINCLIQFCCSIKIAFVYTPL